MSHQEIQIGPGVYITDFRKNANLVGIKEPQKPLTNDVGLLIEQCHELQSKSKMLQLTIEEIKKQKNWEEDGDFREAIQQNWNIIIKFCEQMKEKVLRLAELKYHPSTTKIQQLLNPERIQTREAHAKAELANIIRERQQKLEKQKQKEQKQQEQQDSAGVGIYL